MLGGCKQGPKCTMVYTARDLLFADDCALNACTQSDMQGSMDLFIKACDDFGLTISAKKTEVLHQPAPAAPYREPHKFVFLGGTLSRSANIDEEVWPTESQEPALPLTD